MLGFFYYYDNRGQRRGPFTAEELKKQALEYKITPNTIVENENRARRRASEVPGLLPRQAKVKATEEPIDGGKVFLIALGCILGTLLAVVFIVAMMTAPGTVGIILVSAALLCLLVGVGIWVLNRIDVAIHFIGKMIKYAWRTALVIFLIALPVAGCIASVHYFARWSILIIPVFIVLYVFMLATVYCIVDCIKNPVSYSSSDTIKGKDESEKRGSSWTWGVLVPIPDYSDLWD